MFKPGDPVRRRATGERGVVVQVGPAEFCLVQFSADRVQIHCSEIETDATDPVGMLLQFEADGPLVWSAEYGLRVRASYLRHAYRYDPMSGLSNARIEPQLHQVYVAHRVTRKLQPRMILADEVGLGKTVEAGLIIKELKARGLVERVLVVCPASLQLQWQQEMRSKFNEDFELIDGPAEKFLGKGDRNAFEAYPNIICSLPFASNPSRAERIISAGWDMVVFDEAHRVRRTMQGRKQKVTRAYKLADELKELTEGLLLLSATPMQLHQYELYSLIELAEPGLFSSFEAYDARRSLMPQLNSLAKSLATWDSLSPEDREGVATDLKTLLPEGTFDGSLTGSVLDSNEERERCAEALELQHPLASVLVRNRKSVLELHGAQFARRSAKKFLFELSEEEMDLYNDITEYIRTSYGLADRSKNNAVGFVMVSYQRMLTSSAYALRASMKRRIQRLKEALAKAPGARSKKRRITSEMLEGLFDAEEYSEALGVVDAELPEDKLIQWEIETLAGFVERLADIKDSKARKLLEIIDTLCVDHPDEKILIFTQFRETQDFLREVLEHNGYPVAVFNGTMKLEEKEDAVHDFRGHKQILISTEAGGEGRNFQFAHVMVNYDLPWNPMRVEQRIGRLDRIGQKKPVIIYNLASKNTLEERVLEVLEERIKVFEESVGSLDPILGDLEKDIERIVMQHSESLDSGFEQLDRDVEKAVAEAQTKERILADFMLDRSSMRQDEAAELLERAPLARHMDLEGFCFDLLDYHGGYISDHIEGGQSVSLPPNLAVQLRLRQQTLQGVFDPRDAVAREDLDFFAFGHELVERLLDLAMQSNQTVGLRRLGAGDRIRIEVFYELESVGVRPSGRVVRHVVGEDLAVISEEVNQPPEFESVAGDIRVPDWAKSAVGASSLCLGEEHAREMERVRVENDELKAAHIAREQRLLEYRKLRLEKAISDDEAWLKEKMESGSERDKRIMPAREGKIRKNRERLGRVEADYMQAAQDIQAREASVTARVLAAGLVVGE